MESPRIYVASLSDYNNGRLEGKWLDFSDYSDASELMVAIQEMLDEITEKYNDGEVREEWAVHDYEYIPSTLASEYMGESDFQQIYDVMEVADERNIPMEVLMERVGDTGNDDYQSVAESLMFVVSGNDESDIVHEYESQIGEFDFDFWQNHIYIDSVTERVMYGEDVDRFREDIQYENPDMDEDEVERLAEEQADEEESRRNDDLVGYLEEMGYTDIPSWVSKDYESAWENALSYDFDVINHDGEMYVFSSNYGIGGVVIGGLVGAYVGYKIAENKKAKSQIRKAKGKVQRLGKKIKSKFDEGGQVQISEQELDKIRQVIAEEQAKNKGFVGRMQDNFSQSQVSPKEAMEFVKDNPEVLKLLKFLEKGGKVDSENYEMLRGKIKEVMHHAEELKTITNHKKEVPAWVLAKSTRASTDLSDITHYMDGNKFAKGGGVEIEDISMSRLLSTFRNEKEIFDGQIVNIGVNQFKIENDIFYIKRPNENWEVFRKIKYANGGGVDYKEQQINDLNSWDNDEIANFLGVSISQVAKDRQRYIREAQSVMMLDSYGEGGGVDSEETYYIIFNEGGSYNKRDAVLYRDDLSEKDAYEIANELNESFPSPTDEKLYYVEKASDSRFNYGNINKRFLDSLDISYKQSILRNIANHYGISIVDAEKEVTDVSSELLEDYITNQSLRMQVRSDRRNRRYSEGGGIGFKGLANKVAKRYEGKSVAPKYQGEYGKRYSKSEAQEVGRKVAGKVYWQQQGRKFSDGGGVEENLDGVAYYITESSAKENFDFLSDYFFDSKNAFERMLGGAIQEFYFNINVKNQWNIVPEIYEQMAQEGVGKNEGAIQIIGFEIHSFLFSSDLPYDTREEDYSEDEDDYGKGGKTPIQYKGYTINYIQGEYRADAYANPQITDKNLAKLKQKINQYLKENSKYDNGGNITDYDWANEFRKTKKYFVVLLAEENGEEEIFEGNVQARSESEALSEARRGFEFNYPNKMIKNVSIDTTKDTNRYSEGGGVRKMRKFRILFLDTNDRVVGTKYNKEFRSVESATDYAEEVLNDEEFEDAVNYSIIETTSNKDATEMDNYKSKYSEGGNVSGLNDLIYG